VFNSESQNNWKDRVMTHWLVEAVEGTQKRPKPENAEQNPPEAEAYDPEQDPNWQYQGRSPRQLVGSSFSGVIAIAAFGFFLIVVGAYYAKVHFFGG
jgi:hypothetical protein